MKRVNQCFNKKSRLIKAPELINLKENRLQSLNGEDIKGKLSQLLKIQNDFFPCFDWTFPPPLLNKHEAPDSADQLFSKPSVIPGRYSIYLHSPFCKSLCSFCYYAIIPGRGIDHAETYVDYLIREMAMYSDTLEGQVCESIYFGGGTPSYLDSKLLAKIFDALNKYFTIDSNAEITIEAAPGTLSKQKSKFIKSLGVNRLSYGIQTLDETLLANMNRDYSVGIAITELEGALDVIGNVNVDTMYGFDNEPDNALLDTLTHFYKIGIPSFSIYALDKQRSESKISFEPPKDDYYEHKIRQFSRAEELLRSFSYRPVLQNVFVDPEHASYRHQLRRWDNLPLLAMGINSQGYAPQQPYQNVGNLKSYYQLIDENRLPIATMDKLNAELELCRELTSKLRFTYVSFSEFKYKYGVDLENVFCHLIEALEEMGFVERRYDILRMTGKAAYYNNIIPMLFAPDDFKQQLLGLPEEYLETFPVPYIMTQLGKAQSQDFNLAGNNINNNDRRINKDRRHLIGNYQYNKRLMPLGRRTTDNMQKWAT
ncbi:MAG: coproporphyrinogen III oxidase family protein [Gammaproteobacteria bacterium]|nr:coproporphyrinogen III oxidase family protein [Gammaproteobacteria bacterium]